MLACTEGDLLKGITYCGEVGGFWGHSQAFTGGAVWAGAGWDSECLLGQGGPPEGVEGAQTHAAQLSWGEQVRKGPPPCLLSASAPARLCVVHFLGGVGSHFQKTVLHKAEQRDLQTGLRFGI